MKTIRKIEVGVALTILLLLAAFLVWLYLRWTGPSNADIQHSLERESDSLRVHVSDCSSKVAERVDSRAAEVEKGLEALDAKLDRIEAKIDKLTRLVSPPLPDGLQRVDEPEKR